MPPISKKSHSSSSVPSSQGTRLNSTAPNQKSTIQNASRSFFQRGKAVSTRDPNQHLDLNCDYEKSSVSDSSQVIKKVTREFGDIQLELCRLLGSMAVKTQTSGWISESQQQVIDWERTDDNYNPLGFSEEAFIQAYSNKLCIVIDSYKDQVTSLSRQAVLFELIKAYVFDLALYTFEKTSAMKASIAKDTLDQMCSRVEEHIFARSEYVDPQPPTDYFTSVAAYVTDCLGISPISGLELVPLFIADAIRLIFTDANDSDSSGLFNFTDQFNRMYEALVQRGQSYSPISDEREAIHNAQTVLKVTHSVTTVLYGLIKRNMIDISPLKQIFIEQSQYFDQPCNLEGLSDWLMNTANQSLIKYLFRYDPAHRALARLVNGSIPDLKFLMRSAFDYEQAHTLTKMEHVVAQPEQTWLNALDASDNSRPKFSPLNVFSSQKRRSRRPELDFGLALLRLGIYISTDKKESLIEKQLKILEKCLDDMLHQAQSDSSQFDSTHSADHSKNDENNTQENPRNTMTNFQRIALFRGAVFAVKWAYRNKVYNLNYLHSQSRGLNAGAISPSVIKFVNLGSSVTGIFLNRIDALGRRRTDTVSYLFKRGSDHKPGRLFGKHVLKPKDQLESGLDILFQHRMWIALFLNMLEVKDSSRRNWFDELGCDETSSLHLNKSLKLFYNPQARADQPVQWSLVSWSQLFSGVPQETPPACWSYHC